jgi:hypothetical protein
MLIKRVVGDEHFRHAVKLCSRLGDCADAFARHENIDGLTQFERGGERPRRRIVQLSAGDFR